MNRIIVTLLLVCFLSATGTPPVMADNTIQLTEFSVAISGEKMSLSELLASFSLQSGITIAPVPDISSLEVELQPPSRQTLAEALAALGAKYRLAYTVNNNKRAIVVYPIAQGFHQWMTTAPSPAVPEVWAKQKQDGMRVAQAPVTGGYYPPSQNTEEYKRNVDNKFQDALSSPVSTFAIDVDTASYSNLRRFVNAGKLPPPDSVRTEEWLNYFTYDYPQPTGREPFSLTTEVGPSPWNSGRQLVMLGLQGKVLKPEELPPANLVFLIDVSGSMADTNKLPLLKTAFKLLVKQLREEDTVAIVVYAGQAGVVLEPTRGSDKEKIIAVIDGLRAGGSTAGGDGIKLAYRLAKENFRQASNNRVILATDGDFNVGVASEGELTRLIEERRDDGIFLNVLGFGTGNIKDNKMEALADKGNGVYAYIDNALEAKKVMVSQLAGTLYTIAKDVKLQVEFNPSKVKSYRLIGYENRVLDKQDFNNDKADAGDMGAGHSVTAIYEIIPVDSPESAGTVDPLVYQQSVVVPHEDLLQVKVRYKEPGEETSRLVTKRVGSKQQEQVQSDNFRFAAAVAEYALLLHQSPYRGAASFQQVLELARGAVGKDAGGYRSEFIKLVEVSELLDGK